MQEFSKSPITVADYEQMAHAGLLSADRRYELLEGDIYEMSPIGSPHAACVSILAMFLSRLAERDFITRVQSPVRLDDYSEPEPDVVVARLRDDAYRSGHPQASDILLAIEVADSSLLADPRYKVPLYARFGIPETWVVNLVGAQVELYAEPIDGHYRVAQVFQRDQVITAQTVEGVSISVNAILG